MKRNILVLLTCSLGMTAWGETHVLDGAQSSNSIVYVARYSYDDMGNMVLRRWVPNYASLRMEDGGDSPEELRNLVEGVDVSVRADNLWRNVRFSISGGNVENGQLSVYTTSGSLVAEHSFTGNTFTLDLSSLDRRLYIFHLSTEYGVKDFKLMKTK